MKKFYKATKYLWEISRILLIILFCVAIINQIKVVDQSNFIVNTLFAILILSMITISVLSILKKKHHYLLSFIVGIFTVLFGFLISYLMLTYGSVEYELHVKIGIQLAPLWIILYGLYEIINGVSLFKEFKKNE